MKLRVGQQAPDFNVKSIQNGDIKLSDFKGKKILLCFFRNVNCPFCNMRVHQLLKLRDQFERQNLQMLFFFESSERHLQMSTFHQEISPIPLISDSKKVIYTNYGVEQSLLKRLNTFISKGTFDAIQEAKKLNLPPEKDVDASPTLIPADFLMDENQKIVQAYYGAHLNDHITIDEIKKFAVS